MSGMVRIEFGNETDLQAALGTVGPVSVTIDGNSKAFRVSWKGQGHRESARERDGGGRDTREGEGGGGENG